MKDLGGALDMAKGLLSQIQGFEEELKSLRVTGESGAGMAKVTLSGNYEAISIELDSEIYEENTREFIQDLVVAAQNDAVRKLESLRKEKQKDALQRFGVPNVF